MHPTEALVALQETDLELARAEKRLEELPEKRAILECRRKQREVGTLFARARAYSDEVRRAISRSEDEAAQVSEKMASEQEKVNSGAITDHKELQNLTRELDALRRRRDRIDMETMGLMEKAEKAERQLASIEAAKTKLGDDEASLVEAYKSAGGEVLTRIEALKAERTRLTAALPKELLRRYEDACGSKHGIGAGVLDGAICRACGMELPADRIQALKDGGDIGECPMCRRLIVVRRPEAGS